MESAQKDIAQLNLKNISVRAINLLDAGPELGLFDYIIAQGFYSWVPDDVKEKMLSVCSQHLSPNGVAFVSYNCYPGCHLRLASRNMMYFHLNRMDRSAERVRDGRAFLELIRDSIEGDGIWKAILQEELNRLGKREDDAIYHDELGPHYTPIYFTEFMQSANRHGLQFLGEADLRELAGPRMKPEVLQLLGELSGGDLTVLNQYLDFFSLRAFRRTLLCHATIPLRRDRLRSRVPKLWVASPLKMSSTRSQGTA